MELKETVLKLVGPIHPTGDSKKDDKRLENLATLCELVAELVVTIGVIASANITSSQPTRKRAGALADNFLSELGVD